MTFTTWASESEQPGFEKLVAEFEDERDGAKINLKVVPYDSFFSGIDARVHGQRARRVPRRLHDVGKYSTGVLLDLTRPASTRSTLPARAVGGDQVQRHALRDPAPDRHHGVLVYSKKLRRRGHHRRPDDARRTPGRGRSSARSRRSCARTFRRPVPVRLRLAQARRLPLAVLALPGGRHVAERRPDQGARSSPTPAPRRWTSRRASSTRSGCRPNTRIKTTVYSDNFFLPDGADDVHRRLPGARAADRHRRRLGRHLHAADRRGLRPRRQRDRRHKPTRRTPTSPPRS